MFFHAKLTTCRSPGRLVGTLPGWPPPASPPRGQPCPCPYSSGCRSGEQQATSQSMCYFPQILGARVFWFCENFHWDWATMSASNLPFIFLTYFWVCLCYSATGTLWNCWNFAKFRRRPFWEVFLFLSHAGSSRQEMRSPLRRYIYASKIVCSRWVTKYGKIGSDSCIAQK